MMFFYGKCMAGSAWREVHGGKWTVGSGLWEVGNGKWEVGSDKWEVGNEEWAVGGGKWAVVPEVGSGFTNHLHFTH